MTGDPPLGRLLTAEDVVRRIAAESAFISANGEVGTRLRPAVALVRQYGDQFRRAPPRRQPRRPKPPCFDSVWDLVQCSWNQKEDSGDAMNIDELIKHPIKFPDPAEARRYIRDDDGFYGCDYVFLDATWHALCHIAIDRDCSVDELCCAALRWQSVACHKRQPELGPPRSGRRGL